MLFSCSHLREVSIYEYSKSVSEFDKFPFKKLFVSSEKNGLWGVKNNNCKLVYFDTINNYVGKDHIYIKWDASKCNYIGLGLKWGNYQVKNLRPILESAAIELRLRIDSGEISNLPMFFILEDYGGNQCRANINYLEIEEGKIDANWKKIRVPLLAFNYKKKEVNMSNIKELRLEFQRKGNIHIDNIIIVPHEHNYTISENRFIKKFNSHPIQLGSGKEYWWGVNTKYSNNLQFGNSFENESIVVNQFKSKESNWNTFGFSPYKWEHVDISSIYSTSALSFKIKSHEIPELEVFLFAYSGKKRKLQIKIDQKHLIDKKNGVYEACLPLKSIIGHTEFKWDDFKEIRLKTLNDTQFEIGDFKLVEFRGNPKKPNQWKGI